MVRKILRPSSVAVGLTVCLGCLLPAQAALISSWDIDSSVSYIRLTIPDQSFVLEGYTATARIRNTDTSAWTDSGNGKRMAYYDGTIATNYDFHSLEFLNGQHEIRAIEGGSFRPDPAQYDPNDLGNGQHYTGTAAKPAAYAGLIRGTMTLTFNAGYFAFRDMLLDVDSGTIPMPNFGSFSGNTTQIGIQQVQAALDGLLISILGNTMWVPDYLDYVDTAGVTGTNTLGGSVLDLGVTSDPGHEGEHKYKLTLSVNVPVQFYLEPVYLNMTAAGQFVGYAYYVPEPTTLLLCGGGAVLTILARRRKFG